MSGTLQAARAANISRAPKYNLLICFDAFETLYAPKEPIHKTYGQFARDNGLKHASDDAVARYLHNRITMAAKEYPNYGKHIKGMTPEAWWMKVSQLPLNLSVLEPSLTISNRSLRISSPTSSPALAVHLTKTSWTT